MLKPNHKNLKELTVYFEAGSWQKEIETRHGLRQLTYMKELGMGNDRYILIDLDNGETRMTLEDAVSTVTPFSAS